MHISDAVIIFFDWYIVFRARMLFFGRGKNGGLGGESGGNQGDGRQHFGTLGNSKMGTFCWNSFLALEFSHQTPPKFPHNFQHKKIGPWNGP